MKAYSSYNDEQLLRLIKGGDEAAFTEIYLRHWESSYQAALHVLQDEDACMDVIQDVFVWLWENRGTTDIQSLRPYLRAAVKFKVLNIIRQGKIRDKALQSMQTTDTSFNGESIELEELKEMIRKFTNSLPEQAGKIFHLSRNEHLSHKEIAQQLNISEKTVKNQIHISLKKLKASLQTMSSWLHIFL